MTAGCCEGSSPPAAIAPPVELAVIESRGSGDGLALRATTRIDRYAFGLTKKKGLAARYLDLEITAQATRS